MSSTVDDAVLSRLQQAYMKQKNQQISSIKNSAEARHQAATDRYGELPTSLELIADDTADKFNRLESLCRMNGLANGVALVQSIRKAVNSELREAMSYYEKGYTSAFEALQRDSAFGGGGGGVAASLTGSPGFLGVGGSTSRDVGRVPPPGLQGETPEVMKIEESCPPEWSKQTKLEVAQEMILKKKNRMTGGASPKRTFTIKESLSETLNLFAESMATLLVCEVVRIYLYDENKSLHCCATYPFHAHQGDPMHATHREIMIAKDVHRSICNNGIAVNGSEVSNHLLSTRDVDSIKSELASAGLGGMRSCLAFPIISHLGVNKSLGMIHAVNKVKPSVNGTARFTSDDEQLACMCARVLGCTMTRYPKELFTTRVGDTFFRCVYPMEDPHQLDTHLPPRIIEDVEDAATVGNRAITKMQPLQIFRAPINKIYLTQTERDRTRKLGTLAGTESSLAAVEHNLTAINGLWDEGMAANVVMHKRLREMSEELASKKLLLRNVLDGVAATRSLQLTPETAHYLQTIELLGRSESSDALREYVGETLIEIAYGGAVPSLLGPRHTDAGADSEDPQVRGSLENSTSYDRAEANAPSAENVDVATDSSPFLTQSEAVQLQRTNALLNAPVASKMHHDGPEDISHYTTDPERKRAQVHFLDEMMRRAAPDSYAPSDSAPRIPSRESNPRPTGGAALSGFSSSVGRQRVTRTTPLPTVAPGNSSSKMSTHPSDFANKRPFALKRK